MLSTEIHKTIRKLSARTQVEVRKILFYPGNPEETKRLFADGGIKVFPELQSFYHECNQFEVEWTSIAFDTYKQPAFRGYLNILPPEDSIRKMQAPEWNFKSIKSDSNVVVDGFYAFDYFNSDEDECVGFPIRNQQVSTDLFFHCLETGFVRTSFDLEKYIDHCAKYTFIRGWQQAIFTGDDFKLERIQKILSGLQL